MEDGKLPKHVLLHAPIYPPHSGGASTYFSTLVENTSERVEFCILTARHPDERWVETTGRHSIYRIIPYFDTLPDLVRLVIEAAVGFGFSAIYILNNDVDIVHIHPTSYSSPSIALVAKITGTEVVYDCQDTDFPTWLNTVGDVKACLSVSPEVDTILENSGVPANIIVRTPIINPPYVSNYAKDPSYDTEVPTFIFSGRLSEIKGIFLLLGAFEDYIEDGYSGELKITGGGPLKQDVIDRIRSSNSLKQYVEYLGELNQHEDVLRQIAKADLLVQPSDHETGPRTVLEAFELNTPVMVTDVGIVSEQVEHRKNGIIIEKTSDSIYHGLVEFHENERVRKKLSKSAAGKRVNDDMRSTADLVERVYFSKSPSISKEVGS